MKPPLDIQGFERLEFHRQGLALAPAPDDRAPGVAFLLPGDGREPEQRSCTCKTSGKKTCPHILELVGLVKSLGRGSGGFSPHEAFVRSPWHKLAALVGDSGRESCQGVRLELVGLDGGRVLLVLGSKGQEVARYYSSGPDAGLLAERLSLLPEEAAPNRQAILVRLARMTMTDAEWELSRKGVPSFRLLLEQSIWYRLAYHCFLTFGGDGLAMEPAVDMKTGNFTLSCGQAGRGLIIRLVVPRDKVRALLEGLKYGLPGRPGLEIHPIPLKSIFKISQNTELDLEIRPMVKLLQEGGEEKYLAGDDLERFRYGDLVYLKELGLMAELEKDHGPRRRFASPVRMFLKKSQVPGFLEEFKDDLDGGRLVMDPGVTATRIIREIDRFEITPEVMDRDWYWLDVRYGFGAASVSLAEILKAKEAGQRYIATAEGWLDCQAPAFDGLSFLAVDRVVSADRLRLSRQDLFRLQAVVQQPVELAGPSERTEVMKRLLALEPGNGRSTPQGLTAPLRTYQALGYSWLRFLFENGLGGLLCDEMGLGKTHQAMALMVGLGEAPDTDGPILVICPTTVLSHWSDKIKRFAPGLKAQVFHGPQRRLGTPLGRNQVVVTSYGVLLQDIETLSRTAWSLAVLDEAHYLKNAQTQTYRAAQRLPAGVKLGLTGTPLENRLEDLKALFDLVLPGYLGTDHDFTAWYAKPVTSDLDSQRRRELTRLISPFVLRRLKASVLTELPDKIEDVRTCMLSDQQAALYRELVESRGRPLIEALKRSGEPVPYIHIFAMLNLLKRICDHPALATKDWQQYESYESGKWELFKEILQGGLESGEKVVVYSQYLDMINIMEKYLGAQGVDFVTLTGKSRNRGELVSRFETDPDCKVFVGSLKAGGIGIDLVAASVVIHYDRWWNSAREDQATDRVHRIGQRKGVQVFKLITEGTLEEKIAAIIDRKKKLLNSVVREDDPDILKTFGKEELAELLSF
jgi:superfamily II DNA or RNA helicase